MSIGTMMAQLSQNDYAAHCFLKVTELEPSNAANYCLLGQTMAMQENFQDALEFFEHAEKLNPNNAIASKNSAIAFLAIGNPDKAIKKIEDTNSLAGKKTELILLRIYIHTAFLVQKLKNQFKKLTLKHPKC